MDLQTNFWISNNFTKTLKIRSLWISRVVLHIFWWRCEIFAWIKSKNY